MKKKFFFLFKVSISMIKQRCPRSWEWIHVDKVLKSLPFPWILFTILFKYLNETLVVNYPMQAQTQKGISSVMVHLRRHKFSPHVTSRS